MLILSGTVVAFCIVLLLLVPHALKSGLSSGMLTAQRALSIYRRLALAAILCSIAALLVAVPFRSHDAATGEFLTIAVAVAGLIFGIIRYRKATQVLETF
jgi:uncharacterized membrane protein HdeD (DUF308 family)